MIETVGTRPFVLTTYAFVSIGPRCPPAVHLQVGRGTAIGNPYYDHHLSSRAALSLVKGGRRPAPTTSRPSHTAPFPCSPSPTAASRCRPEELFWRRTRPGTWDHHNQRRPTSAVPSGRSRARGRTGAASRASRGSGTGFVQRRTCRPTRAARPSTLGKHFHYLALRRIVSSGSCD